MKIIDLFAGFGGFSLAGHCMGWETLLFCENASYPKKVLRKNFPGIAIHDDINDLTKQIIEKEFINKYGYYDPKELIFTAGVPCQPASQAGKRKGTADNRWLWAPTLRIVREVKPAFVICENVPGLLSLENGKPFDWILTSLEAEGYEVESFIIPACSVGAWHRRERIWIIAYSNSGMCGRRRAIRESRTDKIRRVHSKKTKQTNNDIRGKTVRCNPIRRKAEKDVSDTESTKCKCARNTRARRTRFTDSNWWAVEPELGRVAHGISNRVERLKGLGNAIVPQVAFEIFKAIELKHLLIK